MGNLYKTVRPPRRPCTITSSRAAGASFPEERAITQMQPAKPSTTSATPVTGSSSETCLTRAAQIAPPSTSVEKPAIQTAARRIVRITRATASSPTAVAISRCVCSTATLPVIFGTSEP